MLANKPKPFPARWSCDCVFCNTRILKNDLIHWNRSVKGQTSHYACAEKHDFSYETVAPTSQPFEPSNTTVNPAAFEPTKVAPSVAPTDNLASMLASAIMPEIEAKLSLTTKAIENLDTLIQDKVSDAIASLERSNVTRVEVFDVATDTVKDMGIQHKQFTQLLQACQARDKDGMRLNFNIVGPAGSGKTTAAHNVAKALNMPFVCMPSIFDATIQIFGYYQANGTLYRPAFREIWQNGGIVCIDEFDGSIPNEGIKLNAPLANGACLFPDGMIPRHKDCIIIVNGNTFGHGATSEYVGRFKLDGATLDRFCDIAWELDSDLELATAPNKAFCERVQAIRAKVAAKGIKVLVTPRATYKGCALLATGMSQDTVEAMVLRKAMTQEQWDMVSA